MNNKDIRNIIILLIILIMLVIINLFKYNSNSINRDVKNINWYRYNNNSGYYDKLLIKDDQISYFKNNSELINCTNYKFDKMKMTLNLDCNKKVRIFKIDEKSLVLEYDDIDYVFFKNPIDSLNYEFKSYFEKSIVDYKKNKIQVTEFSKINENKLLEVIKVDEYSKIVFIGDNCTSVSCVLALDVMEKWISMSQNIYFYDSNNINSNITKYINNIDKEISDIDNFYNDIYPTVLITKNNKIIDKYNIKCSGLDCKKYYKNEF